LVENRNQESGIRNQESGIRNQKSGIRNQESEIRNQKSGIRNQESEIRNHKNSASWDQSKRSPSYPDNGLIVCLLALFTNNMYCSVYVLTLRLLKEKELII